jgi:hypothetical protein
MNDIDDNNPTPPTVNPGDRTEPAKITTHKKPLLILGVGLLAILVSLVFLLAKSKTQVSNQATTGNKPEVKQSDEPKEVEQIFINPMDGTKTQIGKDDYYAVTSGQGQLYYGMLSKINNNYIRVSPTAYSSKSNTLLFTGNELHGPEAATYFLVSKIGKLQKLDPANQTEAAIIEALKSKASPTTDAYPEQDINKYIKNGQFQSYFFADGSAYFARTTTLDGNFLANSGRVYILQTTPSAGGPSARLVLAKPEQYNHLKSNELLYWQNMKADSQISKAALEFEKNH